MTIVEVSGRTEKINVILKQKNDIEYYHREEISLSKMRYKEGGFEEIKNSNITLTSKFSIEGYDLVKLTYICPNGGNPEMISQKYYFAPTCKDLKIKEETVTYTNNDTSTKPNCPLFYLNIGYLYKFKHNKTEKDYSNLAPIGTIKEISSKTESHIFFKGIEDPHLTISCFYRTPDGSITTIIDFVNKDKTVGPDINEKQVAKDKIVLISSSTTTISPNTVKKEVKGEENNAFKRSRTLIGVSMLFLLLLSQL